MSNTVLVRVVDCAVMVDPRQHECEDIATIVDLEVNVLGLVDDSPQEMNCLARMFGVATFKSGVYQDLRYANVGILRPLR